jgi:hypothetical protein
MSEQVVTTLITVSGVILAAIVTSILGPIISERQKAKKNDLRLQLEKRVAAKIAKSTENNSSMLRSQILYSSSEKIKLSDFSSYSRYGAYDKGFISSSKIIDGAIFLPKRYDIFETYLGCYLYGGLERDFIPKNKLLREQRRIRFCCEVLIDPRCRSYVTIFANEFRDGKPGKRIDNQVHEKLLNGFMFKNNRDYLSPGHTQCSDKPLPSELNLKDEWILVDLPFRIPATVDSVIGFYCCAPIRIRNLVVTLLNE